MKFLIAPDKFKDALDAPAAAAALAAGIRDARPEAELDLCPMADGGEGTGAILAGALDASPRTAAVHDPLFRPRTARWWRTADGVALLEMAEAAGLWLVPEVRRDPMRTSTYGVGELIRAALSEGCTALRVCAGGSATVDGGAGCLQALGWRMFDAAERELVAPVTGGQLSRIARLQPPADRPRVAVEILADVNNPLLGHRGAARVFGPQKGASPAQVRELTLGLHRWARALHRATRTDPRWRPGGGAAGGLAAALAAAFEAPIVSGAAVVLAATRFSQRLAGCTACLTGEGRLDAQTHGGKVVAAVSVAAAAAGVPCVAFAGQAPGGPKRESLRNRLRLGEIIEITNQGELPDAARARTAENLRAWAAEWLRRQAASRGRGPAV